MSIQLKGKNVLITGGSSGMGLEMTKELLIHGATVIMSSFKESELDNAYKLLSKNHKNIYTVQMDITKEDSVKNAADWYNSHFDHLDVLINGAGVGDNVKGMDKLKPGHHFYEIPVDSFRMIIETNFTGYFIVSKYFVPLMAKNGKGKLVYISTSTNTMTMPGQIPYGPSKAASETMTAILAEELKALNITVNVICPGEFTDTAMAKKGVKEFFKKNNMPILEPTVMNKIALFLASDLSDKFNNEKLIGKEFDQWLENRNITLDI